MRMSRRLRQSVLASTEADLEPDLPRARHEARPGIGDIGIGEAQPRERPLNQQMLAGPQRVAALAAIKPVGRRLHLPPGSVVYRLNADFRAGTRSIFSQVNVPFSSSGSRPKWP